jgi:hypothetical protein
MMKSRLLPVLLLAASASFAAGAAHAQIFISATGKDSNSCFRTAPCRTLQRGVDRTGGGRELTVLTSGEYGEATITRGMTIRAEGISANIRALAFGSSAITIDAPGEKVVLKGLFLTGGNRGRYGVRIEAAAAVEIHDCEIERFTGSGILSEAANSELYVYDSISRSNGQDGLLTNGQNNKLTVDSSRFENNAGNGLSASGVQASITRSVASGNGLSGFLNTGGATTVTRTTAADNGGSGFNTSAAMALASAVARGNAESGLHVSPNSTAVVSSSVFAKNDIGVSNHGEVYTLGDSINSGNTQDEIGDGEKFAIAY